MELSVFEATLPEYIFVDYDIPLKYGFFPINLSTTTTMGFVRVTALDWLNNVSGRTHN